MVITSRKSFLSFVVLGSLLASLALASGAFETGASRGFARSAGVTVTDFGLNGGQEPWGVTFDTQSDVWVAVPGCDPSPTCGSGTPPGKIEEYSPASSSWIATYQLPAGFGQPLFVEFDGGGNLWFAMPMSNSIGMLNPVTQAFQQFAVPTAASGPWGLAIDHRGTIWFTEHYTNKIGEFVPSTQTMREYSTPSASSLPYGIAVDAANDIWFTENNSAVANIGEYTVGGKMHEYKIRNNPPGGLTPHMITVDPNGTIWWTEGWVGMLGELVVAHAVPGTNKGVSEYAYPVSCPGCGTHTSGIHVDGYGQVWFDDSMQGTFGSFPDTGKGAFSMYAAPTPLHPHDGLNVDAQNRIWFTEEFANKLARAVPNNAPPSPTVSPTPATALARDTFQRLDQKRWGVASDGQTWGANANSSNVFSIKNNSGHLSNGASNYYAVLGQVATNAEVDLSGSLSAFNNTDLGAVLRWQSASTWYEASIDGTSLIIRKKVNGATTTLKALPFAAAAGTVYSIDFSGVGTALSANVWVSGTAEPTAWMITAVDSSLLSGSCGLRVQLRTGIAATVTSFGALYR